MGIVIKVEQIDEEFFRAVAPCGSGWAGMLSTEDVKIVVERALEHVKTCPRCTEGQY